MSALLPAVMIANYFLNINISSIMVFSCDSVEEKMDLLKGLTDKRMFVSWDISSLSSRAERRIGVTISLSCNESQVILNNMSAKKMFNLDIEWLLMEEERSEQNIILPEMYILPGSSVTLARSSFDSVSFYDLYRITKRLPYVFTLLGKVPRTTKQLPAWERPSRDDYRQNVLHTVVVLHSTNISELYGDPSKYYVDRWQIIHFIVVMNLADQLNFRYDVRIERIYGWQLDNGSFGGVVGVMGREEVDFGATGIIMRDDRGQFIDYTIDYFEFKTGVMFKQPSLSSVSNIYLLPFSSTLWLSCVGLLFLALILLLIPLRLVTIDRHANSSLDIVTNVLGIFCQQGCNLIPFTISGRGVVFISSLASLFLYTSYSANIVALLQSTTTVLKTLKDLTHSGMGFKVQMNAYHQKYFMESTDADVINLYKSKVENHPEAYVDGVEGVGLMRTGEFAYCVEYDIVYKEISRTFREEEKCGLGTMHLFFVPRLSIPVTKKSGHREHFKQKIIWQWETGMLDRISRVWLARKPKCESKGAGYLKVGLKDFRPALTVAVAGCIVAVVVFIFEMATITSFEKCRRRTKMNGSIRRSRPFHLAKIRRKGDVNKNGQIGFLS